MEDGARRPDKPCATISRRTGCRRPGTWTTRPSRRSTSTRPATPVTTTITTVTTITTTAAEPVVSVLRRALPIEPRSAGLRLIDGKNARIFDAHGLLFLP